MSDFLSNLVRRGAGLPFKAITPSAPPLFRPAGAPPPDADSAPAPAAAYGFQPPVLEPPGPSVAVENHFIVNSLDTSATAVMLEPAHQAQVPAILIERTSEGIHKPPVTTVASPISQTGPFPAVEQPPPAVREQVVRLEPAPPKPLALPRSGSTRDPVVDAERPVDVHIGAIEIQVTSPQTAQRPASPVTRRSGATGFEAYHAQRTYRRRL